MGKKILLLLLSVFAVSLVAQTPENAIENDFQQLSQSNEYGVFNQFIEKHKEAGALLLLDENNKPILAKFVKNAPPKSVPELTARVLFGMYASDFYHHDSLVHNLSLCIPYAENHSPTLLVKLYFVIGTSQGKNNKNPESIENLEKALALAQEQQNDSITIRIYNNMAAALINIGKKVTALDYLLEMLKVAEENDYPELQANGLMNLAEFFRMQDSLEKSLSYSKKALALFTKLENYNAVGKMHNNIGITLDDLGQLDSALWHLEQGLHYAGLTNDLYLLPKLHVNIADYYVQSGKYQAAMRSLDVADSISKEIGLNLAFYYTNWGRANIFASQNQPEKAIYYLLQSEPYADTKELEQRNALKLADLYFETEDFKNAYRELLRGTTIRDSIQADQNEKDVQELLVKFESEKQRAENEKLKTQNIALESATQLKSISIMALLLILILATGFFAYANQKKKVTQHLNQSLATQVERINHQNNELKNLDTLNKKLLSVLSHDMRSPLLNIRGILELIQGGALTKEEEHHVFQQLHVDIVQTENLLQNIVNWVKASKESGFIPQPENLLLHELVDSLLLLYGSSARTKGLQLDNRIPKNSFIVADEQLLHLALRNLLSNALKFSYEGSQILVYIEDTETDIRLAVQDFGPGMTAEKIASIYNGDNTSAKGTKDELGTGLGLRLTIEAIESMGGKLIIESSLGNGSTFWIELPK